MIQMQVNHVRNVVDDVNEESEWEWRLMMKEEGRKWERERERDREKGREKEKERKKRRVNVSEWLHEVAHILMDGHSILLIREETN